MARVALLTMSDGRDFVARDLAGFCREAEDAAFPHFTMFAASATSGRLLLLGSMHSRGCLSTAPSSCRFDANHIHAVPGDRIAELQPAYTFLGISFEPLGSPPGSSGRISFAVSPQPPAGDRSLLLVGESWFSHSIHQKGFDSFTTSTYEEGCADFIAGLQSRRWTVEHVPSHLVDSRMPATAEALAQYSVLVLSDVGSNTFLLGRQTFVHGRVAPDLLELIAAYTAGGGGLVMIGGYMSFGGIDGKAGYGKTCLQNVLPVTVSASDDRVEKPAGVVPCVQKPDHPTVAGITGPWPSLLGYNRLTPRPPGQVVATCGEDPLLVAGTYGQGRCVAFASDMGPHWAPEGFIGWDGYPELWDGIASWAAGFDR